MTHPDRSAELTQLLERMQQEGAGCFYLALLTCFRHVFADRDIPREFVSQVNSLDSLKVNVDRALDSLSRYLPLLDLQAEAAFTVDESFDFSLQPTPYILFFHKYAPDKNNIYRAIGRHAEAIVGQDIGEVIKEQKAEGFELFYLLPIRKSTESTR